MKKYVAIAVLYCFGNIALAADTGNTIDAVSVQSEPITDGGITLKETGAASLRNMDADIDAMTADIDVPDTLPEGSIPAEALDVLQSTSSLTPTVIPTLPVADSGPSMAPAVVEMTGALPAINMETKDSVEQASALQEAPSINAALVLSPADASSNAIPIPTVISDTPSASAPSVENAVDRLVMSTEKESASSMPIPAVVAADSTSKFHTPWNRPEFEFGILAGGSGGYIPVNEELVKTSGVPAAPNRFRFQLSGEGFSGGIGASAMYRRGQNTFGASITGYLDTHSMKNYDHKKDIYSDITNTSMTYMDRSYTLEFAAKVGRYLGDYHLYGKLGFLCSAFQYKYRGENADATHNITAWGGVAGIGLERTFDLPAIGESKIGLQYNYQLYETLTPAVRYTDHISTSKLRPRYHNGYLTISKTF